MIADLQLALSKGLRHGGPLPYQTVHLSSFVDQNVDLAGEVGKRRFVTSIAFDS